MSTSTNYDAVIVGAGVAGLISAAVLSRGGLRVVVLERRNDAKGSEDGADLALWPGAVKILKKLGVEQSFFDKVCYALHTVHMCNMNFDSVKPVADVLTTIDMKEVTKKSGENFALVARAPLMRELQRLVKDADVTIHYGVTVSTVTNGQVICDNDDIIQGRVILGCDGARSVVRTSFVAPQAAAPRFAGEIVLRGVVEVNEELRRFLPDPPNSRVMRINYGAGLRSSFGHMSGDGKVAYWWVKVPSSNRDIEVDVKTWPEPLRALHDATRNDMRYTHCVEDSATLDCWSRDCVALVGDAAHLVTPNMGQGACMAIEDAFVLSTLLLRDWNETDLKLVFESYENVRKPYAAMVAAEAYKQLVIGQLTSWPLVWLRNRILRNVPPRILQRKLEANCFDVDSHVEMFDNVRTMKLSKNQNV